MPAKILLPFSYFTSKAYFRVVRLRVRPCCVGRASAMFARCLRTQWREFNQTMVDDVVEATDEQTNWLGSKVEEWWSRSLQGQMWKTNFVIQYLLNDLRYQSNLSIDRKSHIHVMKVIRSKVRPRSHVKIRYRNNSGTGRLVLIKPYTKILYHW